MSALAKGSLRVWWVPQMPMDPFTVNVTTIDEALLILDTLGCYDAFQFEHKIKPDYCNAGGLEVCEQDEDETLSWLEWESDDGDSIDDLRRERHL